MKKIAFIMLMTFAVATVVNAQQEQDKKDVKVKKTANVSEKVHNTFSKNKHYNGYKVKTVKHVNGHDVKSKTKVHNDQ